jgi:hypothetical protein
MLGKCLLFLFLILDGMAVVFDSGSLAVIYWVGI